MRLCLCSKIAEEKTEDYLVPKEVSNIEKSDQMGIGEQWQGRTMDERYDLT